MSHADLLLAANQGAVGGGEVMLLELASTARELGLRPQVIAPAQPDELVARARTAGLDVQPIEAADRRGYLAALRRWDRGRAGLLWCNGLAPALATAGRPNRVVHLHQPARGLQRWARLAAVRGAREVLVPSSSMGAATPHTTVLANWTGPVDPAPRRPRGEVPVVGFLGRTTPDKGVEVLAAAISRLTASGRPVELVVAGDARFGSRAEAARVDAALAAVPGPVARLGWTDPAAFFSSVDLAVFPSVWAEPFGLVAAEAMAAGVPFVVSDAGALPEVAGSDHPWIARAGDPNDLAAVIEQALAASDDEVARTVSNARARWAERWSPEAGRTRFAALLRRLDLLPAEVG